mmetsp:Transcript_9302/g.10507  ORF Transcript_9302/g.10507 Transcript_9302/m.10507 type:complete len:85 (+) Transcript_9302:442-696(+)
MTFINCKNKHAKIERGYSIKLADKVLFFIFASPLERTIKQVEFDGSFIPEDEEIKTIAKKFNLQVDIKKEYLSGSAVFIFPKRN